LLEADLPLARIVVLDGSSDASACREALSAGASAYHNTAMEPDAFIKALDLIMVGGWRWSQTSQVKWCSVCAGWRS